MNSLKEKGFKLSYRVEYNTNPNYPLSKEFGTCLGIIFNSEIDERDYKYYIGLEPNATSEKSMGVNYDVNYKQKINGWDLTFNQTFFYI